MHDPLKEAFGQIHAEAELKEHTLTYLREKTGNYAQARSFPYRPVLSMAACLLLVLCLGLWRVYFTPVSVISIDINPSIELSVNRFDRVVAVEGRNQDGSDFAETLDVMHQNYKTAVEEILESDTITQCLAGRVDMDAYSTGKSLKNIGVTGGGDSTTEAAVAKLFFLLGQYTDNKEVVYFLKKNIRGELTEM